MGLDSAFFKADDCARVLGMRTRDFLNSVKAGLFPVGIAHDKRPRVLLWTKQDIEVMIWLSTNRHRMRQVSDDEADRLDEQEE